MHADCRQLLTTAAQQTTALDVMEHMSTLQEAALERLYRWTSSQCREGGREGEDTCANVFQRFGLMWD